MKFIKVTIGGKIMRKTWTVISLIAIISILLIGCSGKNDEENNNNVNGNEEEVNGGNSIETESDQNEVVENSSEENNLEENLEEETFADEIKVLDVETVLLDQDEVSEFKANEDIIIEHDELLYVEHNFITEVLDYELTYDEENTFAEVFEGKGDFKYEPAHEDEDGALMDIGQIYIEDSDQYENISADEEGLYKFIEYKGKLYVSERLINVHMKSPMNYERRDQILEIGLHSEIVSFYDIGIADGSTHSTEVTQNASDVTVEGENHGGAIVMRDVNSADKEARLDIDYNYSEAKGFVHNRSDEEVLEIKFQYDDEKILDTVNIKPGETHKFNYNVKGEAILNVLAKGEPGSSSEIVIIGEVK